MFSSLQATLIPVYEGVPMLKAWQAQPLASEAVHQELASMIMSRGTVRTRRSGDDIVKLSDVIKEEGEEGGSSVQVTDEVVEDVKIRLCFVTSLNRGQQIQVRCFCRLSHLLELRSMSLVQKIRQDASSVSGLSSFLKRSVPTATYPLGGDTLLYVDGTTRESACEVMFEQVNLRGDSALYCVLEM